FKEMFGLAYRTDFDLKNHAKHSGADLEYFDQENNKKYIPHVVEPTFGLSRVTGVVMVDAYREEEVNGKKRIYMKFAPKIAPVKVAVFPLLANKPEIVDKTRGLYKSLKQTINGAVEFDDRGNIGKRYLAQDEIGTPWCITVDFQTLEDDTVTVRHRDTTKQERLAIKNLAAYFQKGLAL
ncbi:MAG TPA: His/Gly/Thr/Pro-type tRNA ligase C-terminal domain-containing protein, partial [Xanthomonadales bacterium]|nr:His/Gly/Thr/Pro-type tRNA ligase C-terminal domain-containing protein [Xanthomonadales bacterium]